MNTRRRTRPVLATLAMTSTLGLLTGCATVRSGIRDGHLDLQHTVSNTVFLAPSMLPGTIYLEARNSSGHPVDAAPALATHLTDAGYQLTENPDEATYLLQLNVRQIEHRDVDDQTDVEDAMKQAAIGGVVAAAAVGTLGGEAGEGIAEEVLVVGAILAFLLDSGNRAVAYTMTTDVRITERIVEPDGSMTVLRHETQVVGAAVKLNLDEEEAVPALAGDLARVLGGMFSSGVELASVGPVG